MTHTIQELPLSQIKPRPHKPIREINQDHVNELVKSIRENKNLQLICVTMDGVIVDGAHRHMAFKEIYKGTTQDVLIPVRVTNYTYAGNEQRAMDEEVIANEYRKNFTQADIKSLVERYLDLGYPNKPGRPKTGIVTLKAKIQQVTQLSRNTVSNRIDKLNGVSKPKQVKSKSPVVSNPFIDVCDLHDTFRNFLAQPDSCVALSDNEKQTLDEALRILGEMKKAEIDKRAMETSQMIQSLAIPKLVNPNE